MRSNNQKIKLLRLYEILAQETDADNPLCTNTLCNRLIDLGISCDRRTLSRDIELLNECGYEVLSKMVHHEKGYYVEDRSFDAVELQILIDAVQAANFITEKKTASLIDRIAALGGSNRARILKRTHIDFAVCKHSNEQILYNVDALREAIGKRRKVSFFYFDLNEKCEHVYRKDKQRYSAEPLALIYNEDNYYLICYNTDPEKNDALVTYRVDRMENVICESDTISETALVYRRDIGRRAAKMVRMYNGKETEVVLEFPNRLIGAIYDRFGEKTRVRRIDADRCRATLNLMISPTFYSWLFQFGMSVRIVSPVTIIKEYSEHARAIISGYEE